MEHKVDYAQAINMLAAGSLKGLQWVSVLCCKYRIGWLALYSFVSWHPGVLSPCDMLVCYTDLTCQWHLMCELGEIYPHIHYFSSAYLLKVTKYFLYF